ncbi:hypothetical protein QCA50_020175 [Cerrena zonata]|uniref:Uncharacterized protein n=1 Tax=Cerrena zonata TaxID=2478898 RepID=A0AAW0FFG4_9APHY
MPSDVITAQDITEAQAKVRQALERKRDAESASRPTLEAIAHACVESFLRPTVYNPYDLHNFSFQDHVVTPRNPDTITDDPTWLYTTILSSMTGPEWKQRDLHKSKLSKANFEYVTIYDPEDNSTSDDGTFVPKTTYEAMLPLIHANNNVAIVYQFLDHVGVEIFASMLAMLRAWKAMLKPTFVPVDLYEYMDLHYRVRTHVPSTLNRIGYSNRYEVPWHPSINLESTTRVNGTHPLLMMPSPGSGSLKNHLEDIKYMYGHIKAYLDRSHDISSAPDGDEALEDCKRRFQIQVEPPPPTRQSLQDIFVDQHLPIQSKVKTAIRALNKAEKELRGLEARKASQELQRAGSKSNASQPPRSPSPEPPRSSPAPPSPVRSPSRVRSPPPPSPRLPQEEADTSVIPGGGQSQQHQPVEPRVIKYHLKTCKPSTTWAWAWTTLTGKTFGHSILHLDLGSYLL